MLTSLLLAGCVATEPAPTVAPTAPPLMIVTATPGLPPPPTPPAGNQRYVVREGDTLSTIAERFDVTEAAIMDANNLSDPDHILVGQELIIPPPEP
jgi:LysM repeat protein